LINKFDEKFNINLDSNGIYKYNHDFSFEFENGIAKNIAQPIAKSLASGIMLNEVPLAILNQYSNTFLSGKRFYKEGYDIISNKFNFSESFEKSKSGDFADSLYTYQISTSEDGAVFVTENIKITSLSLPFFEKSIDKLSSIKSSAYSRCQGVYYNYYINSGQLNQNSLECGSAINRFNGEITYESKFSNEINIENRFQWQLISEGEDLGEYIQISVNLEIEGSGAPNSTTKWENTVYGYNQKLSLLDGSSTRENTYSKLYSVRPYGSCRDSTYNWYLLNSDIQTDYYNGKINASKKYSNINRLSMSSSTTQASVNMYSFYQMPAGVIKILHPQKSIGRYETSTKTFYPEMNFINKNYIKPAAHELTESSSVTFDYSNHTVDIRESVYTH
jgi:hypothetical protein